MFSTDPERKHKHWTDAVLELATASYKVKSEKELKHNENKQRMLMRFISTDPTALLNKYKYKNSDLYV